MNHDLFIGLLFFLPLLFAGLCFLSRSPRNILWANCLGVFAISALLLFEIWTVLAGDRILAVRGWFLIDALCAYHLLVLVVVFPLSSIYAIRYFKEEIQTNLFTTGLARQFTVLWFGTLEAILLVLLSNNLGILWVGFEATTLVTSLLICLHKNPLSLEATWKYLVICSVGIAFAFVGTLLVGISSHHLPKEADSLMWTALLEHATSLNTDFLKIAFLFLLVGYGTKVGLAPMHTWLPDAHSQAPTPVSAILSGFLLNLGLYCILRYIPILEKADHYSGWSTGILVFFGVVSILVSAAFIIAQKDVKRLLAYHSVEHLGIITLGFGVGGVGVFAALFHTLNHSICKTLSFFCAGRLGQIYGTHEMERLTGVFQRAPIWGLGLFTSILALIGVAPFCIFMSEWQLLKAIVDTRSFWAGFFFVFGSCVVFVGALHHAISMVWGEKSNGPSEPSALSDYFLVLFPLALLLLLGLWMPDFLFSAIQKASRVIGGGL